MPEPFVVVGAAVLRDGRVLATQRSAPASLAGRWEFPGGKVERGESEPDALRRECREELGIDVAVGERVGPDAPILAGRAVLRVYVAVPAPGAVNLVLHEHSAYRWLAADELEDVPWIAEDAVIVAALRPLLAPPPAAPPAAPRVWGVTTADGGGG